MAALRPCARVAVPPSVSVASNIGGSSQRLTLPVLSLRRRGSPTIKHVICANKSAGDQPADPEGDGDGDENKPKRVNAEEIMAEFEFSKDYAAKLGFSYEKHKDKYYEMFYDEELKMNKNMWYMVSSSQSILHEEATLLSVELVVQASEALHIASMIMYCASYRLHQPSEISINTMEQMVRTYVSTFIKIAEDAYHGKAKKATVHSFLGALGGLAAISHILLVDTLDAMNDVLLHEGKPKHTPHVDVEAACRSFEQELASLKLKILELTVCPATTRTREFVKTMVSLRRDALDQVPADKKK